MLFEQAQAETAKRVDARLAEILADRGTASGPERLVSAMRHAVLGGGKRFRPFLVMETSRLFDVPETAAIEVAAALECVHCYSLVHDDLPAMDNDRLRRGQPTVWAAYDEWTAILAGDGLLTLAFEIIADGPAAISPAAKIELVRRLAIDAGRTGMVGGQTFDLEAEKLGKPAVPSLQHVLRLQAMKTGALIRFACEAGAILGAARDLESKALENYGTALGLAFQISDDLLDVQGDAAVVGKAVGKDAAQGKATLISLLGLPDARRQLDLNVENAVEALRPFGARAAKLVDAARFMSRRRH